MIAKYQECLFLIWFQALCVMVMADLLNQREKQQA